MTAPFKITRTFPVGKFTCKMTFQRGGLDVAWTPDTPKGELDEAAMKQYRAGRDALLQEVAVEYGGAVAVVEL
jgi:hypothetical protein